MKLISHCIALCMSVVAASTSANLELIEFIDTKGESVELVPPRGSFYTNNVSELTLHISAGVEESIEVSFLYNNHDYQVENLGVVGSTDLIEVNGLSFYGKSISLSSTNNFQGESRI